MSSRRPQFLRIHSIRKSLLLWLLLPLVCLCALSTVVAYKLAERYANESYDDTLLNSADSIAARLSRNENGIVVADLPVAAQVILRHNGNDKFYYQIVDSAGHRLTGDANLPLPGRTVAKESRFRYATVHGEVVRICRIPVQVAPRFEQLWVQAAETLHSRRRLLQQIFLSIFVPQVLLMILASCSVWLGIRTGLGPLERLVRLLKARSKLDLSPVELDETPHELEPVKEALNSLLLRADKQIRLQRQFVANAAHHLRTPVTALKTYIDHAKRIQDITSIYTVLGQMAEATNRVVHLINQLLTLARTEGNTQKTLESVDLTAVVDSAATNLVHQAMRSSIQLHFDMPQTSVVVQANPSDLEELITSLLDNAIKYTPPTGSVWVKVEQSDHVSFTIEDTGPGIPDNEKARVFERFYRGAKVSGFGCGLGLAIALEIAASNKATIKLADRLGGGTTVRVTFQNP